MTVYPSSQFPLLKFTWSFFICFHNSCKFFLSHNLYSDLLPSFTFFVTHRDEWRVKLPRLMSGNTVKESVR